MREETLKLATRLLDRLFADYACYMGMVRCEEPVPLSEALFVQAASDESTIHRLGIGGHGGSPEA